MSVIEAAAVSVKTMADNTLRLTVDIEPRFAKEAFALFGERGTPMALAALKAAPQPEPEPEKPKGGLLSQKAAILGQDPRFCMWVAGRFDEQWQQAFGKTDAAKTASVIRAVCCIDSRAELDHNQHAADTFARLIQGPYSKHLIAIGATV